MRMFIKSCVFIISQIVKVTTFDVATLLADRGWPLSSPLSPKLSMAFRVRTVSTSFVTRSSISTSTVPNYVKRVGHLSLLDHILSLLQNLRVRRHFLQILIVCENPSEKINLAQTFHTPSASLCHRFAHLTSVNFVASSVQTRAFSFARTVAARAALNNNAPILFCTLKNKKIKNASKKSPKQTRGNFSHDFRPHFRCLLKDHMKRAMLHDKPGVAILIIILSPSLQLTTYMASAILFRVFSSISLNKTSFFSAPIKNRRVSLYHISSQLSIWYAMPYRWLFVRSLSSSLLSSIAQSNFCIRLSRYRDTGMVARPKHTQSTGGAALALLSSPAAVSDASEISPFNSECKVYPCFLSISSENTSDRWSLGHNQGRCGDATKYTTHQSLAIWYDCVGEIEDSAMFFEYPAWSIIVCSCDFTSV